MTALAKSPVAKVRARKIPALSTPPNPPKVNKQKLISELKLVTAKTTLLIGPAIVGSVDRTLALGETATLTMTILDDGSRVRNTQNLGRPGAVMEALTDQMRTVDGARITVDGIDYVVDDYDGTVGPNLIELHLVDRIAWQLRIYRSFRSFPRARFTRAQAVRELIREAGTAPMLPVRAFIPELRDRQRIVARTAVETDTGPSTTQGTGSDPTYKVKKDVATAAQRKVIDAILTEAKKLGATKRVMTAVVMCATQESVMGLSAGQTGNDDVGIFQQGRNWISLANVADPAKGARAFLLGHEAKVGGTDSSVKGWKQRYGSVKTVPKGKSLDEAITAVQISVGGYDDWEDEAARTVTKWLAAGGDDVTGTIVEPYEYTRGDKDGGRENSFTAIGRWADEVKAVFWVMLNTACYASQDELAAAAPVVHLDGDEEWLLTPPAPEQAAATRPTESVSFDVVAQRWALLPGAVVELDRQMGAIYGRYLVNRHEDTLGGDRATITLSRPVSLAPEPAASTSEGGESEAYHSNQADDLYTICKQISDQGRSYVYGGGHGAKLAGLMSTRSGLDCSSSCSLALHEAKMFPGDVAIVSGEFAASWGIAGGGKTFTVWASAEHVWIEFHGGNVDGHRFDTSPHGDGGHGPRLRKKPRSHEGFTARHWRMT